MKEELKKLKYIHKILGWVAVMYSGEVRYRVNNTEEFIDKRIIESGEDWEKIEA